MHSPFPGKSAALPRRISHVDVAELDLTPVEAFVLTQLDGTTELSEVAAVTGSTEADIERTLKRLAELGAVELGGRAPRLDPRRDDDQPIAPEQVFRSAPTRAERDEVVDLDPERRELIDEFDERLELATHYQLLGIETTATRSEVKAAYFQLIGTFHPDRYFGRSLGSYRKKVERTFESLTRAYEVLSRQNSRDEYDEYLGLRRATRALDAVIRSIPPPPTYEVPTRDEARAGAEKRRRRLAGRLMSPKTGEPEPGAKLSPEEARDRLRRLAEARGPSDRSQKSDDFREAGERALDERKWTAAVTSLRIATVLSPDDEQISARLKDAEQHAAEELVETYRARAKYEEQNQQWADAAESHQRVAAGRPKDAEPLARAARCMLHAGNPREAVNIARRAVLLEPDAAPHRLILARAYEANGLLDSAIGELERVNASRQGDRDLAAWIARLKVAKRAR
jgi:curved DNA-binding protein CbpA